MNIKLISSRLMSVLMACFVSLAAIATFVQAPAFADDGEGAKIFNANFMWRGAMW
jgi:hypothetical protein